jgi:hypothetical protein
MLSKAAFAAGSRDRREVMAEASESKADLVSRIEGCKEKRSVPALG